MRWIDLFFDLLYVGVAFLVGHRLEHNIVHHQAGAGAAALDSFAVFFVLMGPWFSNLQYYSRFDVNDALHKGLDILEYALIGCSAVFVPSPTLFWWGIVMTRGLSLVRYLEIAIFSQHENARRMMRCAAGTELVSLALSVALIAPCGKIGALVAAHAWQAGNIVLRVFLPSVFCLSKASSVPLHISFMCHRVGEVMMIMLGETVLSLVMTTFPEHTSDSSDNNSGGGGLPSGMFFASLVMGFAISACLMWIEYLSSTFDAKKHVLRNSGRGGVIWVNLVWARAFALVVVGVALRMMIKRGGAVPSLDHVQLLCGSLAANFGLSQWNKYLHTLGHQGESAHVIGSSTRTLWQRCAPRIMLLLEATSFVLLLTLPALLMWNADTVVIAGMNGYQWVVLCGAIVMFQAVLSLYDPSMHQLEGRFHGDHDGQHGEAAHGEHAHRE